MSTKHKKLELPPRSANAFLEWYCDAHFLEEVQGDLHELYFKRLQVLGRRKAQLLYWVDVVRFFKPYLLRRTFLQPQLGGSMMFKNYMTMAFRNLLKHRAYAFINMSGLVIGLTACILILLYVQDELSYDRFHDNAHRIYRVTSEEMKDGGFRHFAYTYGPLAPFLLNDFADIQQAVRLFPKSVVVKLDENRRFQEEHFLFADSTFFEVFSFTFKHGDPRTALQSPYDIVLTERAARKYFGSESAMGEVLTVEDEYDFRVTGVLENIPANSHLQFEFLASMGSVRDIQDWALTSWYYPPMYTYILLPPHYPVENLQKQFPEFIGKNIGNYAKDERRLHLQPLADIHLHSKLEGEITPGGDIAYVYVFTTIALFILLIACINFMNLATARCANRAKEVGLRKVVGARRIQLLNQFFGESLFYAFLALIVAIGLVELLLPHFNETVDKELTVNYLDNWRILFGFMGLAFLVGLISGSYPAVFLSNFRPVKVLQGGTFMSVGGASHVRFRSILVVMQFAISIGLIINTNVIKEQLLYIKNKNLGFNKNQIIVIPVRDEVIQRNWDAIKNTFLMNSSILGVTATSTIPGIDRDADFPIKAEGLSDDTDWNILTMLTDHDFVRTFGMQIVDGRDFSTAFTNDTSEAFILNETAVNRLGWDRAIGKRFEMQHVTPAGPKKGKVIGVVKDFHFKSLHHKIEPLVIQISPRYYYLDNLAVKVDLHNIAETIAFLEQKWREIVPHRPFEYKFLDTVFEQIYRKEQNLSRMFNYFSVLAIFIGCLGLFGLASFTAEQRTKEIGIRKVLGASVSNIVIMLSKELAMLIGIAFLIASPIAYYFMSQWLEDFTYKIDIHFTTFLMSGVLALVIALFTIFYQVVKAAVSNPIRALRYQ